jgi:hypothetical protein
VVDAALTPLRLAGFVLASWAVIGNDSLQTLGPFLETNRGRTPRWLQALGLCGVLCGVLLLGWWRGGDASWGRLASFPELSRFGWAELLPPLAVLLLTQAGVPVSTSFLVLTAFSPANLPLLLRRSLLGYGLALGVGLMLYGALSLGARWWQARPAAAGRQALQGFVAAIRDVLEAVGFAAGSGSQGLTSADSLAGGASHAAAVGPSVQCGTAAAQPCADGAALPQQLHPATGSVVGSGLVSGTALALQWIASGWLWSQWLIQDLANVFIYLPRQLDPATLTLALALLCGGVCLLLAERGGAIQSIVRRKSGLHQPAASAALSLVYGSILGLLASRGREPLSTTWVFLGLLAGRELALRFSPGSRPLAAVAFDLGRDLALAALGLAVSLAVALAVQPLRAMA